MRGQRAEVIREKPLLSPVTSGEAPPARVRDSRLFRVPFGNGIRVNFPVIFAPMAGLSHLAFRQLVRTYLPANAETLLFTEMLSTRLLPGEDVGRTPKTRVDAGERDLVPQLLGNDERWDCAFAQEVGDPLAGWNRYQHGLSGQQGSQAQLGSGLDGRHPVRGRSGADNPAAEPPCRFR